MPQIQVIPAAEQQPSFGTQLGQALGGGVSQGLSSSLSSMLENRRKNKQTEKILEALGISLPKKDKASTSGLSAKEEIPTKKSTGLNLTPEKVLAGAMLDKNVGNVLGTLYQSQQKGEQKLREHEIARSEKFLDKIESSAEGLPERRIAINSAKAAVESGQMTPFGGDFMADVLHLPQLRTASGAALATAAKTNIIGSLSQLSAARPNQFLEQQINNAFAKAGQTREANLAQLAIIESKLDIDQKLVDLTNELSEKYEQELGYVPSSIGRETQKQIKPYVDQKMKELAYDLQELNEKDMGVEKMSKIRNVAKGTPLTTEMAQVLLQKVGGDEKKAMKLAINLGYEIPSEEIYSRVK